MRSDMDKVQRVSETEQVVPIAMMTEFLPEAMISRTMTTIWASNRSITISKPIISTSTMIYIEPRATLKVAQNGLKATLMIINRTMMIVFASLMIIIVVLTRLNANCNPFGFINIRTSSF